MTMMIKKVLLLHFDYFYIRASSDRTILSMTVPLFGCVHVLDFLSMAPKHLSVGLAKYKELIVNSRIYSFPS